MGDLIDAFAGLLEGIGASPSGQVILGVITGFILLEVMGLIEYIAVRLLRVGGMFLPSAVRERYIEENEAVIREKSGAIAKLFCAISALSGAMFLKLFCRKGELEALERRQEGERTDARREGIKKAKYDMTSDEVIIIASLITNDKPEYRVFRNKLVHSHSEEEQRKILREYVSYVRHRKQAG
jgi:hypothetical protein